MNLKNTGGTSKIDPGSKIPMYSSYYLKGLRAVEGMASEVEEVCGRYKSSHKTKSADRNVFLPRYEKRASRANYKR